MPDNITLSQLLRSELAVYFYIIAGAILVMLLCMIAEYLDAWLHHRSQQKQRRKQ